MSDQSSIPATLLDMASVAELLGVSPKTVRRMITRGELDARRIGPRLVRVSAASVETVGHPLQYVGGRDD